MPGKYIMDEKELRELLLNVKAGKTDVEEAVMNLRQKPIDDLGFAQVDLQRGVRTGNSEVIFGAGKTADQIAGIASSMLRHGQRTVLVTRLDADKAEDVRVKLTSAGLARSKTDAGGQEKAEDTGLVRSEKAEEETAVWTYRADARMAVIGKIPEPDGIGKILVITAGTSDIPVAEEAAFTAEALGNQVVRVYDAGVAGLHRLLAHMDDICKATVIIAIAGMEGALPAVVTGLADCPVIAVPTSVGYGTSFHGMSALLSMLNCCASGMAVENIDNGFGAAYFASMINHLKGI